MLYFIVNNITKYYNLIKVVLDCNKECMNIYSKINLQIIEKINTIDDED